MAEIIKRSDSDRRTGIERRSADDNRVAKLKQDEGERRSGKENRAEQDRRG